jgi:hypothetical protein
MASSGGPLGRASAPLSRPRGSSAGGAAPEHLAPFPDLAADADAPEPPADRSGPSRLQTQAAEWASAEPEPVNPHKARFAKSQSTVYLPSGTSARPAAMSSVAEEAGSAPDLATDASSGGPSTAGGATALPNLPSASGPAAALAANGHVPAHMMQPSVQLIGGSAGGVAPGGGSSLAGLGGSLPLSSGLGSGAATNQVPRFSVLSHASISGEPAAAHDPRWLARRQSPPTRGPLAAFRFGHRQPLPPTSSPSGSPTRHSPLSFAGEEPLQSWPNYLAGEARPADKQPTADVVWGQTERDRVYVAAAAFSARVLAVPHMHYLACIPVRPAVPHACLAAGVSRLR